MTDRYLIYKIRNDDELIYLFGNKWFKTYKYMRDTQAIKNQYVDHFILGEEWKSLFKLIIECENK